VSKPNDSESRHDKLHGHVLATLGAVALIAGTGVVFGATAGIVSRTVDRIAPNDPAPAAATVQKPPGPSAGTSAGTFQLRCWQYGRLLFDEGPVTLGPEARQGARLVAIDRNGAPLIVTGAGSTTCLARPHAAAPNLALPR
jgi:hypothetical protein